MSRPAAPADVRRILRQDAGFGCCLCGHPFIQYHHIVPWAEDQHFRPEDMMVLCGNHHHLATVGALLEADQRTAKKRPKNIADGLLRGSLFVNTRELTVHLAGGVAINTPKLLEIKGQTVLAARLDPNDGRVLVSAQIQNRQGRVIATVADNEWRMVPDAVWDFEAYPLHAKVRSAPWEVAFDVDARNDQLALGGAWFRDSMRITFSPTMAMIGSNRISGSTVRNCGGFIAVG